MTYKPSLPYTTVLELYKPTYSKVKGVTVKGYEYIDNINCSFKTYGGTETTSNDTLIIEDTANVETWYRPDIISGSQLKLGTKIYEVISEPENIDQRNQFLKFKVRSVKGGT